MDEALPGFGILIGKRTKTFFIVKGQDRRLITLGRYPDLSLREARLKAKAEMGQSTTPPPTDAPTAILAFLEGKKNRIEPHTYYSYKHYLESLDLTGNLDDITDIDLDQFDDSPSAQHYAFNIAKGFFNWCVDKGYMQRNPLRGQDAPTRLVSRDRVLTDEELALIWKHTNFKPYGYIVRLLLLTGQRRMEIKNLTTYTDVLTFTKTKNKIPHLIPVTPLVKEHLALPFTFNDWSRAKERLDKKVGFSDWVHHDLRRTVSTNMAKLGVPLHITELLLNHRTTQLSGVAKVYNRYNFLPEMEEALLTWEQHIVKITSLRA